MIPSMMSEIDIDSFMNALRDDIVDYFDEIIDNVKEDMEVGDDKYWYTSTVIKYTKDHLYNTIKSTVLSMETEMKGKCKDPGLLFKD
jgi:hypothetical protein